MDSEMKVISNQVNHLFVKLQEYRDMPTLDTTWFAIAKATIMMVKLSHDELVAVLALALTKMHYSE